MSEEDAAIENPTPIKKQDAAHIAQVLGAVEAPGSVIQGVGAGNSTRWVFDLEAPSGARVDVYLLDPRNRLRRVRPDLMSYSLAALSSTFYDARPVAFYDPEKGLFAITSTKTREGVFACRVAIDVMHSATR
jgi:hypothetical protein